MDFVSIKIIICIVFRGTKAASLTSLKVTFYNMYNVVHKISLKLQTNPLFCNNYFYSWNLQ